MGRYGAALGLLLLMGRAAGTQPVGTAFTYQGRLTDAGAPVSGTYDLRFILYGAPAGGVQVGPIVALEDVAVTAGLFTVSLDFGPSAFAGQARFLEVGVRPGTSTGGYTALSPRQELKPAPHAVFGATSPWASLLGKPSGFADDVDDDVLGGLGCSNGQVPKWAGTVWACAADVDTNSGGTVMSVATGAGLAGGPITSSGTLSVATGGISSSMIANGAVGLAQVNQAQIQARIGGTCALGEYLRGINADGTVVCEPLANPHSVTTVYDVTNSMDSHTSLAIGADGLPVVAYHDSTGGELQVLHCGNPACTSGNTISTPDNVGLDRVGSFASLAIGTDGLPVISYYNSSASALRFVHCGDPGCTAGNFVRTLDTPPPNTVGQNTSIAIGADGLPVISYYDGTAGALKVAHCHHPSCATSHFVSTVDEPSDATVGLYTSIAIGADGLPVISYWDFTNRDLKVAHCGDVFCAFGNTITTVDNSANHVGAYSSIAVGTDGLPVISYFDGTAGALRVAHCGNAACSGGNDIITTVDDHPLNTVGINTSIAIATNGLPIISYYDETAGALRVTRCGNQACSAGNTTTTLDDSTNAVGDFSSIAIGADGLPVISYLDVTAGALKVARCGNTGCR